IHTISSILLVPTLLVLLLFVAITAVELGGLVAEILLERRRMRINVPELLDAFQGKDAEGIRDVIAKSRLLRSHKIILSELTRHSQLPANSLQALARRLLS
ncbi:MAG: MotA/TolQ/ExbB proton channel family protein, partial [Thermacetogeniaceae bacterium]